MDKILELLGANKLNEDTQEDLKEKLQTIIEVESKKLSDSKLTEEKQQLVEDYEKKFDEYKEDITQKFSNFVDNVLEKELVIPEKIMEYAKKGELYHDLIEQFKVRLSVDQGLLDEEVKGLLKEAKDEILRLRKDMDQNIKENLELKQDAQEMAAALYLHDKCRGLTESQREHMFSILSGIVDKDEIDRKFEIVKESERFDPVEVGNDEGEKVIKKMRKKSDPKSNEDQVEEDEEIGQGQAEINEQDDEEEDDDEENGNGKKKKKKADDEEDDDEDMNESSNPFNQYKKMYMQVLKEGI
jgi:hypothetical protein